MLTSISDGYGIRPYGNFLWGAFHMLTSISGGYGIRPYGII